MLAIASKESQLVEGIEAKDKEISRLEAQIGKVRLYFSPVNKTGGC